MTDYLYGIDSTFYLTIEKTEIVKVSAKTIRVRDYIEPYHTTKISKDSKLLAWTREEAIDIFIATSGEKIAELQEKIDLLKSKIEQANDLY